MFEESTTKAIILESVRRDVETGLGDFLYEVRFQFTGPFADRELLIDPPYAVVQWLFEGVDCVDGFNGMWPTGKTIEVSGVTIVDFGTSPTTFHRHVDWNAVNSQLGGSRGRTSGPLLVKNPEDARFYAADHNDITTLPQSRTRPSTH